jgi:transposase
MTVRTPEKLSRLGPAIWTLPRLAGVSPATNTAESVLRPLQVWPKLPLGAPSEDGSAFIARIMAVVMTLRVQASNVLESMMATYEALR